MNGMEELCSHWAVFESLEHISPMAHYLSRETKLSLGIGLGDSFIGLGIGDVI